MLGAHVHDYPGFAGPVHGTSFAVWAPNAQGVRVVGDFNYWDGRGFPMRSLGSTGVWELFVPGLGDGTRYKFEILGRDGVWRQKADPMASATEAPPATASVVEQSSLRVGRRTSGWQPGRATDPHTGPMSVYEVHLGSWRQGLAYRAARRRARRLRAGRPASPTSSCCRWPSTPSAAPGATRSPSYYAPTARFGHPDDFRYLVDTLHQAGIGVHRRLGARALPEGRRGRWPASTARALYEHADPRRGEQPDWGTLVFDFGRSEVRNFLVANALYWLEEFHVDGLRVDAVASMLYLDYSRKHGEWMPNELRRAREPRGGRVPAGGQRHRLQAGPRRGHDRRGVHRVARRHPADRTSAASASASSGTWAGCTTRSATSRTTRSTGSTTTTSMTFSMMYAYSENFVLPLSHDEVVHGKGSLLRKMPGDRWQQLATLRAYFGYMWAHPGKQLLFMGGEFAQEAEWSEAREPGLVAARPPPTTAACSDWSPTSTGSTARRRRCGSGTTTPAGFEWIDAERRRRQRVLVPALRRRRLGAGLRRQLRRRCRTTATGSACRSPGRWDEVLNTDSALYSGSGVGNLGAVTAERRIARGRPASAR